jgi:hypothetical protein
MYAMKAKSLGMLALIMHIKDTRHDLMLYSYRQTICIACSMKYADTGIDECMKARVGVRDDYLHRTKNTTYKWPGKNQQPSEKMLFFFHKSLKAR